MLLVRMLCFVVVSACCCVSCAVRVLMVFEFCSLVGWLAEWRQVLPSEWGTAQKPWFIFTKNYWCPGMANRLVAREKRLLFRLYCSYVCVLVRSCGLHLLCA